MENNRVRNTTRNMVAGVVYRVVSVAFPFVINTIIIKTLGVEYLGISSLFASILQVLSLTELGFGASVVFSMYEPVAKNDHEKISALLALYRKVYLVMGSVILAGGLICIPILPLIISGDVPDGINIYVVFIMSLANSVISYFLFGYKTSLFQAYQRKDIMDKIYTVVDIVMNFIKIAVLLITKNYYLFYMVTIINTIMVSLLVYWISKKKYPLDRCRGSISKEEKKNIFSRVVGVSLHKLCNVVSNSFDNVVISSFLGLTVLGQYNNYFVIINAITLVLYLITNSAISSIGNSLVCESLEKNHEDFVTFQFGFNLLTGWGSVCVLCLIQPFIEIWLGNKLMFDEVFAITIAVYLYSIMSSIITMVYRDAAGIWTKDKVRPFVEAILNLIMNIVLVQVIGICGVMISTIITMGIMRTIWGSHYLFKEYFKGYSHKRYLLSMLLFLLVTIVAGVPTYLVCGLIPISGIIGWIVKLGVCIVIPGLIYGLCYFRSKEFKNCIWLVKSVLGVNRGRKKDESESKRDSSGLQN